MAENGVQPRSFITEVTLVKSFNALDTIPRRHRCNQYNKAIQGDARVLTNIKFRRTRPVSVGAGLGLLTITYLRNVANYRYRLQPHKCSWKITGMYSITFCDTLFVYLCFRCLPWRGRAPVIHYLRELCTPFIIAVAPVQYSIPCSNLPWVPSYSQLTGSKAVIGSGHFRASLYEYGRAPHACADGGGQKSRRRRKNACFSAQVYL